MSPLLPVSLLPKKILIFMVSEETVLASHDAITRLILTQFNVETLSQSSNHFIGKTPFPEDINLSFSEDSQSFSHQILSIGRDRKEGGGERLYNKKIKGYRQPFVSLNMASESTLTSTKMYQVAQLVEISQYNGPNDYFGWGSG